MVAHAWTHLDGCASKMITFLLNTTHEQVYDVDLFQEEIHAQFAGSKSESAQDVKSKGAEMEKGGERMQCCHLQVASRDM